MTEDTLSRLQKLLWPPEDPERSWDSDTIAIVAEILSEAGYGPPIKVMRSVTVYVDVAAYTPGSAQDDVEAAMDWLISQPMGRAIQGFAFTEDEDADET